MDSVEEKLAEMEWPFVDSHPAALEELMYYSGVDSWSRSRRS